MHVCIIRSVDMMNRKRCRRRIASISWDELSTAIWTTYPCANIGKKRYWNQIHNEHISESCSYGARLTRMALQDSHCEIFLSSPVSPSWWPWTHELHQWGLQSLECGEIRLAQLHVVTTRAWPSYMCSFNGSLRGRLPPQLGYTERHVKSVQVNEQ